MALTRRVRKSGDALAVTIPAHLAQEHGIREGDSLAWESVDRGVFRVKKASPGGG